MWIMQMPQVTFIYGPGRESWVLLKQYCDLSRMSMDALHVTCCKI